jgi:hypothetical protein
VSIEDRTRSSEWKGQTLEPVAFVILSRGGGLFVIRGLHVEKPRNGLEVDAVKGKENQT